MSLKSACEEVGKAFFPQIRDPRGFLSSFPNWEPLNIAFPGKIGIGDIDGLVERNGQFLLLEKKQEGAYVHPFNGQTRTLKALHDLGNFTILYFWGPEDDPKAICVIRPGEKFRISPVKSTYRDLLKALEEWWIFADNVRRS